MEKNIPLKAKLHQTLTRPPVVLTSQQRSLVHEAIVAVCEYRQYFLRDLNVRSNHVHAVVSKSEKPEKIVNDFKAYATKRLRNENEFGPTVRVWSRGASTRYLWKPKHVLAAVDYVLYSQGDIPFDVVSDLRD